MQTFCVRHCRTTLETITPLCSLVLLTLLPMPAFADKPPEVRLGLMAALSGDASSLGDHCRKGFDAARHTLIPEGLIGGRKVTFVYSDSRGQGGTAVTEFQKLATIDSIIALLTHLSQTTMQLNSLAAQRRMPVLAAVAHPDFVRTNPYAFGFWPTASAEANELARALRVLNARRMAIISVEDEYTLALRDELAAKVQEGTEIVFDARIARSDHDFLSLITKLKNAKPEVLFVNVGIAQIVPFIEKCRAFGLNQQIIGNVWFMTSEVIERIAADFLQGAVFVRLDPNRPKLRRALEHAGVTEAPTPLMYACFAEVAALAEAIARVPGRIDPATLFQALSRMTTIEMPDETLTIRNRQVDFPITLNSIKNGTLAAWPG